MRRPEADKGELVDRTREYYNSSDADRFYHAIWGGEDIHIGIYLEDQEPIATASRRTVEHMVEELPLQVRAGKILDLGSGYGGSARHLAAAYGARMTCLNLSEIQNQRNRKRNLVEGLDHLIQVVDGNFEDLPFDAAEFDVVWSQDAILHSNNREQIFREVDRVLVPGGHFVFTDPMQVEGTPARDLAPVLARLDLDSLGSIPVYREFARKLGWKEVKINSMPGQLIKHYQRVGEEFELRSAELQKVISTDYSLRMLAGLRHWVEAGRALRLDWGILHFQKTGARAL